MHNLFYQSFCGPKTLSQVIFSNFLFSTVHTLLANDEMEYNKWEQLSNLLPEVAWYNSWDKCKRLRKAAKQRSLSIDFSRKNKDGK